VGLLRIEGDRACVDRRQEREFELYNNYIAIWGACAIGLKDRPEVKSAAAWIKKEMPESGEDRTFKRAFG
jgi:hypothetical protein